MLALRALLGRWERWDTYRQRRRFQSNCRDGDTNIRRPKVLHMNTFPDATIDPPP